MQPGFWRTAKLLAILFYKGIIHAPLVGLVAQLVEQCPFKAFVRGSSPRQPTNFRINI